MKKKALWGFLLAGATLLSSGLLFSGAFPVETVMRMLTGTAVHGAKGQPADDSRPPQTQNRIEKGEGSDRFADSGMREAAMQVTRIEIRPRWLTLPPGGSEKLTVIAIGEGGMERELTAQDGVVFTSGDGKVAAVDQAGNVRAADSAQTGERATVKAVYGEHQAACTIRVKPTLEDTIRVSGDGVAIVTNVLDRAVLVNKKRSLPPDYVPPDLVKPNIPFAFSGESPKKWMRKEAAAALERLFAQAKKERIAIAGVSAYRSYERQKEIFQYNVRTMGKEKAVRVSASPGRSEHQTGLAIDISCPRIGYALEETFAHTPEGRWLAKHAPAYGFIIRYPKGKEHITGYAYEPWHLRYVGEEVAKEIAEKGITLEEYYQLDAIPVQINDPS
ncbi:hypothetical protein BSNK01_05520 [Bacillaceae bacterium]